MSCYGIRLRRTLRDMSAIEFLNLLRNLDGDTPFMKTFQIRATDRNKLPDYLRIEKTRQNRIMFQRGYFDSMGDSESLKRVLMPFSQAAKKEGD